MEMTGENIPHFRDYFLTPKMGFFPRQFVENIWASLPWFVRSFADMEEHIKRARLTDVNLQMFAGKF